MKQIWIANEIFFDFCGSAEEKKCFPIKIVTAQRVPKKSNFMNERCRDVKRRFSGFVRERISHQETDFMNEISILIARFLFSLCSDRFAYVLCSARSKPVFYFQRSRISFRFIFVFDLFAAREQKKLSRFTSLQYSLTENDFLRLATAMS